MKQVITKFQIPSREDFIQRLSDLGLDFGLMYWQHDRVYLPRPATHAAHTSTRASAPSVLPLPPTQKSSVLPPAQKSSTPIPNPSDSASPAKLPAAHLPRLTLRTEVRALDKPAHYELIFKRFIPDSGATIVHRTPVENYTEVTQILHQLGFTKHAEVSRQRQDLPMGDNVILHLDHIETLPRDYVKLETSLEDGEKVSEVLADLDKTLQVLGVGDAAPLPYFELLRPHSGVLA